MQPGDPIDPLPDYIPPFELPGSNPELAKRYPISLISPKPHAFLNTQYANEERPAAAAGRTEHPDPSDRCRPRNIKNGTVYACSTTAARSKARRN